MAAALKRATRHAIHHTSIRTASLARSAASTRTAAPRADPNLTRAPRQFTTQSRRSEPKQRHLLVLPFATHHNSSSSSSSSRTRLVSYSTRATDTRRELREDGNRVTTQLKQQRMASDEDYMSFLNKANQDADDAHAAAAATTAKSNSSKTMLKALDAGEEAPKAIRDVCAKAVYVSDADEPFEQVSLKWTGEGGLPDEEDFAKLISHWDAKNADISIMDPADWDVQGQYKDVIEAVRQASRGNDVRVYKVVRDATRVEYWVVTRAEERIVGAKALAVES